MLVLHGSWLPATDRPAAFAVWGEFAPGHRLRGKRTRAATKGVPRHPFDASGEGLAAALIAGGAEDVAGSSSPAAALVARLPTAGGIPLPSPALAIDPDSVPSGEPAIEPWSVDALLLQPARTVDLLTGLQESLLPLGSSLGDDLRFWIGAARFVLALLHRQRLAPALRTEGTALAARWRPLFDGEDEERLNALTAAMPPVSRALARDADEPPRAARPLLTDFIATGVDALARQAFAEERRAARRAGASRRTAFADAWLAALAGDPIVKVDTAANAALIEQARAWAEPPAPVEESFRLCFRLDPPAEGAPEGEWRWTLRYLLQANDDPSLLVSAADVWRQRGATARFLNRRFDNPQERLLAGLGRAARLFQPIEESLRAARPEDCPLTAAQAYDFVREASVLLAADGFGVLLPGLERRIGLRLRLGGSRSRSSSSGKAALTWDSVVAFNWQLAVGEQTLTPEEFEELVRLKEPLVQVRGQWVELRPEAVEEALAFLKRHEDGGEVPLDEALRLALAPESDNGVAVAGVEVEGDFAELLDRLRDGSGREHVGQPEGFAGQLRPYQEVGASWLATLAAHGLGACLADDMGLGKTPTTIARLLHARGASSPAPRGPALIICPTSVVGNWRRELERFAPSLKVLVHHGAERHREDFDRLAREHDVVVSSYSLLHRDAEALTAVEWSDVVLDEAQNIKNASTKAAQAARALPAGRRIALTGTPVENRLTDLWSIFQFLNPGLLGSEQEFRRRFAAPIERMGDESAAARLRALTAPFVLRRLKTDRSIISDLPEKNEMKVFCPLTSEQATLYQAVLEEQMREIEESEGVQRRGQVLATLTKLKQVCNHPALFLHDSSRLDGRSGKLARLVEMLEEVVSVGDRALIFTQYAEMGRLLQGHLEATLNREALFLHGGTPAPARDRMVSRFQADGHGPQIFILSVKAGGTGLNLTRANHVFHFDRWWNPAVENQATDRAFRIGQRRDVQVHKYICGGTFEEQLDGLIERKLALAESISGRGESWITEMSTSELRQLFALRDDAIGDG